MDESLDSDWARATANAFDVLRRPECAGVAKPGWWNDEDLKALSKRIVQAAPEHAIGHHMRAVVLSGIACSWEAGPRSAAELKEAAKHFERCAELSYLSISPAVQAEDTEYVAKCLRLAAAMETAEAGTKL